jgi:hypothetical protein
VELLLLIRAEFTVSIFDGCASGSIMRFLPIYNPAKRDTLGERIQK